MSFSTSSQCLVCYEDKPLKLFVHCNHSCCETCANKLDRCPFCRAAVCVVLMSPENMEVVDAPEVGNCMICNDKYTEKSLVAPEVSSAFDPCNCVRLKSCSHIFHRHCLKQCASTLARCIVCDK